MPTQKILIIERNPRIGELISGQLNAKGYDATDVRHGAEAATSMRYRETDLILLDNEVLLAQKDELVQQVEGIMGEKK
jgi:DNA-binding response OmpR family regulator